MSTRTYVATATPDGQIVPFVPVIPDADSKMAQDRETRAGHKDGIALILRAPFITRHTDAGLAEDGTVATPDRFATVLTKPEVRLTADQMAEAITGPVVKYAISHPDASAADALVSVLSHPITFQTTRGGANVGTSAITSLADALAAAITAARANVAPEAAGSPESDDAESGEDETPQGADSPASEAAEAAQNAPRARGR